MYSRELTLRLIEKKQILTVEKLSGLDLSSHSESTKFQKDNLNIFGGAHATLLFKQLPNSFTCHKLQIQEFDTFLNGKGCLHLTCFSPRILTTVMQLYDFTFDLSFNFA